MSISNNNMHIVLITGSHYTVKLITEFIQSFPVFESGVIVT